MASSLVSTPASLTFRSKDGTHAGHIRSFTDNDIAAIKAAQTSITNLQNRVVALDDDRFIVMSTEPATADNGKIWIKAGMATKTVTHTLTDIIPAGSLHSAVIRFSSEPASSFPDSDAGLIIPAVVPNTIVTFSASLEASASNNLTILSSNDSGLKAMPFASFSLEDNTGFGYYGDPFTDDYVKLYYGEFESTTNDIVLAAAQIANATVVASFIFPQIEYESVEDSIAGFSLAALDMISVAYSNSNATLGYSWTMTDPTVTYTTWAD